MIEVKKLNKNYGSVHAVRDVTFSVGKGEIVGLLGPNGAGKTTILKVLTGYHFPSSGNAVIDGFDVSAEPLKIKQRIGYLPENSPVYPDLTVWEYLDFISDARDIPKTRKKQELELVTKECGLKNVLNRPIEQLSKGFKQRVGLAQAIIHRPEILILDEPTTGLDPKQILEIRDLIKQIGKEKTVILSTHILREVEAVCSRVLILNKGKIAAAGTPEEIGRDLKGGVRMMLRLKGNNIKESESALSHIKCIQSINGIEYRGDTAFFKLSLGSDENSGEELFDWAVEHNYKITEMSYINLSLEDIFIQLTSPEGKEEK